EEVQRAVAGRRIDALLISISGNDVGFAGALKDLAVNDGVWASWGRDAVNRKKVYDETLKKIEGKGPFPERDEDGLPRKFEHLNDAIKKLHLRRVYITEYPTGLFEKRKDGHVVDGGPCGVFEGPDMDIDVDDGRAIKELGKKLNE